MFVRVIFMFVTGLGMAMFVLVSDTRAQAQQNSSVNPATPPTYPETATGLEKLAEDIFRAAKKNDTAIYSGLISILARPVSDEWFQETFGDEFDLMLIVLSNTVPHLP